MTSQNSFVLFPIGDSRFALPAERVSELARPDRLQTFPNTTRLLVGVLVRRGRIVPVCDIASVLVGPKAPCRRFYLIATRGDAGEEWTAIPVTGECELAKTEMAHAPGQKSYVIGVLLRGEGQVPVIDLDALIAEVRA